MTLRDAMKDCSNNKGLIKVRVRPMNHLHKFAKHLDNKGEMTVELISCQHPHKINNYCSSECPILKEACHD